MRCQTPTSHVCPRSLQSAYTLIEVTVASGLVAIVGLVVMSTMLFMGRSFEAMGNYSDLNQASRQTLDIMTSDIRQAKTMTSFATNQLAFTDLTNGTFSYTWDPSAATLTRVYNGQSMVLLTSCDSLVFHISQRSPSNNFVFWPASAAADAKLVDVSWICSRQILGQKVNTESVQTAKITIRN